MPAFDQSLLNAAGITPTSTFDYRLVVRLLKAIEAVIAPLQSQKAELDGAISTFEAIGLERINEILVPAIQSVLVIQERGFLVAHSETANTLVQGDVLTFYVEDPDERVLFTPSPFVAVTREDNADDYAIARRVSYDKDAGAFICEVLSISGDPGPHADWVIGAMAGPTLAAISNAEYVAGARQDVLDAQAAIAISANAVASAVAGTTEASVQAHVWAFSDETVDADPGDGALRLNHASVASATRILVDNLVAGGGDAAAWLDRMSDSTNTGDRGAFTLRQVNDSGKWATFKVDGVVVDGTGYRKVPVVYVAGPGGFVAGEPVVASFARSGNRGVDGEGAGDVLGPAGATDGNFAVLDATGKELADSGMSPASVAAAIGDKADAGHTHGTGGIDDEAVTYAKLAAALIASVADIRSGAASKVVTAANARAALEWVALTDASTINVDHNAGINRKVTLGGNRTIGAPSSAIPGAPLNFWLTQGSGGSKVPNWNAAYDFGEVGPPLLSTGAGQADLVSFICLASGKFAYTGIRKRVD